MLEKTWRFLRCNFPYLLIILSLYGILLFIVNYINPWFLGFFSLLLVLISSWIISKYISKNIHLRVVVSTIISLILYAIFGFSMFFLTQVFFVFERIDFILAVYRILLIPPILYYCKLIDFIKIKSILQINFKESISRMKTYFTQKKTYIRSSFFVFAIVLLSIFFMSYEITSSLSSYNFLKLEGFIAQSIIAIIIFFFLIIILIYEIFWGNYHFFILELINTRSKLKKPRNHGFI